MTDTTTNNTVDAAEIDADTETGHEQAIGSLEHLDPHALQIGENVRDAVDLDKELLASLRQHGVLVPITAVRSDVDGRILVRNGQRRTLGAREVGLSSVPVYVLPATASDETAEAVERIVHQIVTNDQKADLTDAQRARGIQQMIDAGLSGRFGHNCPRAYGAVLIREGSKSAGGLPLLFGRRSNVAVAPFTFAVNTDQRRTERAPPDSAWSRLESA